MKKYLYIVLFLAYLPLKAQLVTLPDTNFSKAICTVLPSVMDGGCLQLDTSLAQNIDDALIIPNANISDAIDVTYFNRIDTLILSGNNLESFLTHVQTSVFWSLHYLDISDNELEVFPIVSVSQQYQLVDHIYFQNNKATEFQKLWGARDSLIVLDILNNFIPEVQDLSMALKAKEINLSNNYLTFEHLVPQTNHPQFSSVFTVAPQREVKWVNDVETGKEHVSFSLQLPIDNDITSNTYTWYKGGVSVATTTSNTLTFDSLKLEDAGIYTVKITNSAPLLNGVELSTEEVELVVNSCMDVFEPAILIDEKCNGARTQFIDDSMVNGVAPYEYELTNGDKIFTGVDGTELELPISKYQMSVTDATGCIKQYKSTVSINGYVGCDENVITPDGDGLQDEYYFDVEGEVKIYNRAGQLIRELHLPKFWDGKTESGQPVSPGKYIIVINEEEKIYLKVVW